MTWKKHCLTEHSVQIIISLHILRIITETRESLEKLSYNR